VSPELWGSPWDEGVADRSVTSHIFRLSRRAFLQAARRKLHDLPAIAVPLIIHIRILSCYLLLAYDR